MKVRLFLTICLSGTLAFALPIPNVRGTGVDNTNAPLVTAQSGNNVFDGRFSVSGPVTNLSAYTYNVVGTYFTENSTGTNRWISAAQPGPTLTPAFVSNSGIYSFSYQFDMTGLNPATASILGRWGTDNCGEIWLNGAFTNNSIGGGNSSCNGSSSNFTSLSSFLLNPGNSNFNGGLNTLEFRVYNYGGPLALMVTGVEANAAADVPEPASCAFVGAAIATFAMLRRRNNGRIRLQL